MAIDTLTPRSRRALLAASLGGLAATVADALGRPAPARAANGNPIIIGSGSNEGTAVTELTNTAFNGSAFEGTATGSGIGVSGSSSSGVGVYGSSTSGYGVRGFSASANTPAGLGWSDGGNTGLLGYSGEHPVPPAPAKTGVYGSAGQDSSAVGVLGESDPGNGVVGTSTSQIGVVGLATGASGPTFGVFGRSNSSAGIGVGGRGYANMTGVAGYSGSGTFPTAIAKTGVYGLATPGLEQPGGIWQVDGRARRVRGGLERARGTRLRLIWRGPVRRRHDGLRPAHRRPGPV